MQTTVHMFKNHPNKDRIRFAVLPSLTEGLFNSCDIASDIYELEKSFLDCGIKFDFSMITSTPMPQLWQLYNLKSMGKSMVIEKRLQEELPKFDKDTPNLL